MKTWYTIFATGNEPKPPKGPFHSHDEVAQILLRFYPGGLPKTTRIMGPYSTRELARQAHAEAEAAAKVTG
jgi:hypothetical protein